LKIFFSESRVRWTNSRERALIDFYSETLIEPKYKKGPKLRVFNVVAKKLNTEFSVSCYDKTIVKNKFNRLQTKYRKEKRLEGRSGAAKSMWPLLDAMAGAVGGRPSNTPMAVINSASGVRLSQAASEVQPKPQKQRGPTAGSRSASAIESYLDFRRGVQEEDVRRREEREERRIRAAEQLADSNMALARALQLVAEKMGR